MKTAKNKPKLKKTGDFWYIDRSRQTHSAPRLTGYYQKKYSRVVREKLRYRLVDAVGYLDPATLDPDHIRGMDLVEYKLVEVRRIPLREYLGITGRVKLRGRLAP